jgi:hypothetical protein
MFAVRDGFEPPQGDLKRNIDACKLVVNPILPFYFLIPILETRGHVCQISTPYNFLYTLLLTGKANELL